MHIDELGHGPAVVLLHGMPCPPAHLLHLGRALAKTHRVLVPHLPGYGATPALDGEYSIARTTELLVQALRARGVESLAVAGYSAGAYRAFHLALRGGLPVRSVVSLAGYAGFDATMRAGFRGLAVAVRAGTFTRPMWIERALSPRFGAAHADIVTDVSSWFDATSAAVLASELEAAADAEDLRGPLESFDGLVVARVGALDLATPPALSEEIVTHARDGRLEIVPECGHAILHEDTAATLEAVRSAIV